MRRIVQVVTAFILLLASLTLTPLVLPESALAADATVSTCTEAAFDAALDAVQAGGGGTINFSCAGTIAFDSVKVITSDVTIVGGGAIILEGIPDENMIVPRLFLVESDGRLALDGLTLRNPSPDTSIGLPGSAIRNEGTVQIVDSAFTDNRSVTSAGAISNVGGTLQIEASTFNGNRAPNGQGGAINNIGGSVSITTTVFDGNNANIAGAIGNSSGGTLMVTASTFSGNEVTGGFAGAIANIGGTAHIVASTFSGNGVNNGSGGGAINNSPGGVLTVTGSTFSANDGDFAGGAIRNTGQLEITASNFIGNSADIGAGGVDNSGQLEIYASTFVGNTSGTGGSGGAIFNNGTAAVTVSTFSANFAGFAGGAIANGGTLAITASTFSGNDAFSVFGGGGAIFNDDGASATIQSSIIAASPSSDNCLNVPDGSLISGGSNLSDDTSCGFTAAGDQQGAGVTINLSALAFNGGPTLTMLLLPGSDAIDAADCTLSSSEDQRGVTRPLIGTTCDIGAVELEGFVPVQLIAANSSGGAEGSPVTVNAAASGPAGTTFDYDFDCDNNGSFETQGTGAGAIGAGSCTFNDNGNFFVGVRVCDAGDASNCDTGQAPVTVSNLAPTITSVTNSGPVGEGSSASITVLATDPAGVNDPLSYSFDCDDDGSFETAGVVNTGQCAFVDDGSFLVNVQVMDDDGGTATTSTTVTVQNIAPSVEAGVHQTVNEGDLVSLDPATFTDPGTADTHTCSIDWDDGPAEPGTINEANGSGTCAGSHTYLDDGIFTVEVQISDDDGGQATDSITITVLNVAPSVDTPVIDPSPSDEGESVVASASFSDPGTLDLHTCTVDYGDGSGPQAGTVSNNTCTGPQHTYLDDDPSGTASDDYSVIVSVTDGGIVGPSNNSASQTVANLPPTVSTLVVGPNLIGVNLPVALSADFTDPGILDTHTASIDWGDSVIDAGSVNDGAGSGTVEGSHAYTAPGIYTVTLTVSDDDGGLDTASYEFVVVFDQAGGFVTGGGWIDSPTGAFQADPSLTDKAHFSFVAEYKKNASVPTGNMQFKFKAGDLSFKAESYEWLVVNPGETEALFAGTGTVNKESALTGDPYQFMIWAGDGAPDTFRIRIWYEDGGAEVEIYDSGVGQPVGGGSIVIHAN